MTTCRVCEGFDCTCGRGNPIFADIVGDNVAISRRTTPIINMELPVAEPIKETPVINYKFKEDQIWGEVKTYIDSTYFGHYAKGSNKVQTTELIAADPMRGLHFCLGNIMKYADRTGYKEGLNRKDLLKVAHYTVMALKCLDDIKETDETK